MASKVLSGIRTTVRQFLRDEFEDAEDYHFPDDEIDLHIADCVVEISERWPYEVKETLTTTAGSKNLDVSSIEDLLLLDPEHEIEYPTGKEPPEYHNVSRFADILRMEVDRLPAADEDVYLYCFKVHQLTEDLTTLNPQLEKLVVDGAVAKTALAWINDVRALVKESLSTLTTVETIIGTMSARIQQAIDDLTSGRTKIGKINIGGKPQAEYATYAARELGNANSALSQSQGYLRQESSRLSATGVINSYQVWANNKLILYQKDLKRLGRPRTYVEHAK